MVRVPQPRAPWQTLDNAQLLLIALAALVIIASLAQVAAVGLEDSQTAVIFGALVALGELARITMPGNREVAPIATAVGLGYAMLIEIGPDQPAGHSALQVVAVAACGTFAGSVPHAAVGHAPRLDGVARRLLTIAVIAFLSRPLTMSSLTSDRHVALIVGYMIALVIVAFLLESCLAAAISAESERSRFAVALRDELRAQGALGAAVGATGILVAVSTWRLGLPALLVFTAPILVTQFAFRRYAGVRATYLQTIRALSRVTEVGGYVETGHSRRVSRLAIAMGRELGMTEPELLQLEYAALMHDIGQLSLRDPIPGGATVLASPNEQRRIAELGAEVIRKTGVLDHVAEIVRRQCDQYRGGPDPASPPPLSSRVIKVANAYDDLVGESTDPDRAAAVLDRLRADSAAEYDPVVVEALGNVAGRVTRMMTLQRDRE